MEQGVGMRDGGPRDEPSVPVGPEPVLHRVRLHRRVHRILEVTTELPCDLAGPIRLVLPTWTPGSYVIRDHVRHLRRIRATDGRGEPAALMADGVSSWWLEPSQPGPTHVVTEWYASERTLRTTHVDERSALIVGAATFLCIEAVRDRHQVVHFEDAGPSEDVISTLARVDEGFVAVDYDALADAAFVVGADRTTVRDVGGIPHRVVWCARPPTPDPLARPTDGLAGDLADALADDLARIAGVAVDLLGPPPLDHGYTVLVVEGDAGGLEHRDGTTISLPSSDPAAGPDRERAASLLAHEYLHLWNGRRLSPRALVRPPLDAPAPTPSLWVTEGWTSYYDLLLPTRAGILPFERLLDAVARRIERVAGLPGVRVQSLREASRSAWTKHYRPDADTANTTTDYYAHGSLVALELDLLVRRTRPGSDGLDDVLRRLWDRHGERGGVLEGFLESDVLSAIEAVAGTSVAERVEQLVGTPGEPDPSRLLIDVGVTVDERPGTGVELGLRLDGDDALRVVSVAEAGPAWHAGLVEGDVLRSIDGATIEVAALRASLHALAPGEPHVIGIERDGSARVLEVVPAPPRPRLHLIPDPLAEPPAMRARARWAGPRPDAPRASRALGP